MLVDVKMEESVFFVVEEDAADVHVGIEAGNVKKAYKFGTNTFLQ